MKLYVVAVDCYDENFALAIFDTKEAAIEFARQNVHSGWKYNTDVREMELNVPTKNFDTYPESIFTTRNDDQ